MDQRVSPEHLWPRLSAMLADVAAEERTPPPRARAGAVLVLLEDTDAGPAVVLTRRRDDLRSHPGQISFPGGRIDVGESVPEAALREASEEIGLDPATVEVVGIGRMFYIPPSRFWVVPVIARWRRPHSLEENPWEVDRILRVPLRQLLDPSVQRRVARTFQPEGWAWQLDGGLLWGATARVVAGLLDAAVDGWHHGRTPEDLPEEQRVRPWDMVPSWQRPVRLAGELPQRPQFEVPHVSATQVRAIRQWLDDHAVGPLARAEQAGRALTQAVRRLDGPSIADRTVTVLAGPSTNGMGGLVAARLLHTAGARVTVLTVGAPRAPEQTHVLRASGVPVHGVTVEGLSDAVDPGDVVVDAMLGIGANPPLRDAAAAAAAWLRRSFPRIVALDLPSGMLADQGVRGPCVTVDVTVATGLPLAGLGVRVAQPYAGDLYVADVGVPPEAWRNVGVEVPAGLFGDGPLVRLTAEAAVDAGTPDQEIDD